MALELRPENKSSLSAFRIDGHGMDSPENLLDIVYFDDFKVAAVAEEDPETPVDPGTEDPSGALYSEHAYRRYNVFAAVVARPPCWRQCFSRKEATPDPEKRIS